MRWLLLIAGAWLLASLLTGASLAWLAHRLKRHDPRREAVRWSVLADLDRNDRS